MRGLRLCPPLRTAPGLSRTPPNPHTAILVPPLIPTGPEQLPPPTLPALFDLPRPIPLGFPRALPEPRGRGQVPPQAPRRPHLPRRGRALRTVRPGRCRRCPQAAPRGPGRAGPPPAGRGGRPPSFPPSVSPRAPAPRFGGARGRGETRPATLLPDPSGCCPATLGSPYFSKRYRK